MNPQKIISIIQISISFLLIVSILLQQRGAGGSAIMGGGSASYYTKRGFEKWLFGATIALSALFVAGAVISILLITKF